MSLIDKLKAGTNNIKVTTWPGTKEPIGIRVLTEAEMQSAEFETELLFKSRGIEFSSATVDTYQCERNTQTLARAIMDPDTKSPMFKNADELRALISHPDVKAVLANEYNAWQNDCSPAVEETTEEQYNALFEAVKKNGSSSLKNSSSTTLRGLITYLAERQMKLRPVSGSISE